MGKLKEMCFRIVFDRPVDVKKHYISPGGYVLNGKCFDFCVSEYNIIKDNELEFYVHDFDDEYSEGGVITKEDIKHNFSDFFIYTGEGDDAEIYPLEIKDIMFYFDDGEEIKYPEKNLRDLNAMIYKQTVYCKQAYH